jgi:hypothetical protein
MEHFRLRQRMTLTTKIYCSRVPLFPNRQFFKTFPPPPHKLTSRSAVYVNLLSDHVQVACSPVAGSEICEKF